MDEDNVLRLSFLRALYGLAHVELIQCSADVIDGELMVRVVVADSASPDVLDDLQSIVSEITADFPEYSLKEEILLVGASEELPTPLRVALFLRPVPMS